MRISRKQKLFAILVGSALFTSAARFSFAYLRFREVQRHFHHVAAGSSRAEVERLLGTPNNHAGQCGDIVPVRKGCVTEYVYSHPLAPLVPDYYIVTFSKEDIVIETIHRSR